MKTPNISLSSHPIGGNKQSLAIPSAFLLLITASFGVEAQDVPATDVIYEEVLVTARKRDESLQKV